MTRRQALLTLAGTGSALMLRGAVTAAAAEKAPSRTRLGIVTYAFGLHAKHKWDGRHPGLSPALALLEEAQSLGAAGIQTDLVAEDVTQAAELKRRAEFYGMFVEASIGPPRSKEDVDRFEHDVRTAQAAGASLARTVIFPGRRYEQFKSLDEYRQAQERALQSLQWAEPVLARNRFRLAVENHKDQRIAEKLETLKRLGSEYLGLCIDVGNSFTLMEDPVETVRAYAPYAFTVHFKDQALRESPDGFWFADVPLGEGFLDLPVILKILSEVKPAARLNLELITRDPLPVPILKPEFWGTLPDTPASQLAHVMSLVKSRSSRNPFVQVSQLPFDQQLALESANVAQSLAWARDHAGPAR
jgi:3-oxoisoapionate decarboxylase